MADKYYSIITNTGKALEAAALANGTTITLSHFVVGDGSGKELVPDATSTKLVNEKYRQKIAMLSVSPEQANQLMAQLVIPSEVGGFTVREIGLLTDKGELYALASCAAIEKPVGGINISMQFRLAVSDTANITLQVATGDGLFLRIDQHLKEIGIRGEIAQKDARESLNIFDASTQKKGLVKLNSAINSDNEMVAATSKAVKLAYDLAASKVTIDGLYPVGIVVWFAQNKNPNILFPNTTWKYIGENKTIRLASADGNDLMTVGGRDMVSISKENLPPTSLGLSGTTDLNGWHTHTRGSMNITGNIEAGQLTKVNSGGASGAFTSYQTTRDGVASMSSKSDGFAFDASRSWTGETSNNGAHVHQFSGRTENLGLGYQLDITGSFIKLMGWYRSA